MDEKIQAWVNVNFKTQLANIKDLVDDLEKAPDVRYLKDGAYLLHLRIAEIDEAIIRLLSSWE